MKGYLEVTSLAEVNKTLIQEKWLKMFTMTSNLL